MDVLRDSVRPLVRGAKGDPRINTSGIFDPMKTVLLPSNDQFSVGGDPYPTSEGIWKLSAFYEPTQLARDLAKVTTPLWQIPGKFPTGGAIIHMLPTIRSYPSVLCDYIILKIKRGNNSIVLFAACRSSGEVRCVKILNLLWTRNVEGVPVELWAAQVAGERELGPTVHSTSYGSPEGMLANDQPGLIISSICWGPRLGTLAGKKSMTTIKISQYIRDANRIAIDLMDAGVVHGDLTLDNFIFGDRTCERLYLIDYTFAREWTGEDPGYHNQSCFGKDDQTYLFGSGQYAPPEKVMSMKCSCEICPYQETSWQIATMTYEMLYLESIRPLDGMGAWSNEYICGLQKLMESPPIDPNCHNRRRLGGIRGLPYGLTRVPGDEEMYSELRKMIRSCLVTPPEKRPNPKQLGVYMGTWV
nr:putative serine/threonine kinase-like protein [Salmonid herpesvirus 1]